MAGRGRWSRGSAAATLLAWCCLCSGAATAGAASAVSAASGSAAAQVRAVYRGVLTAEYFGPASGVCSRLTAAGERSFTAGGFPSCSAAFRALQHTLRHKTAEVDDSGFTPAQWRAEVDGVMARLQVRVTGSRARAIGGQSGIPGATTLVLSGGSWKFSSYPPSIQS